jgi:hypothetical protein
MIFMLLGLVPVIGFYAHVFVNFTKELARIRRGKVPAAMTMPLHVQHCPNDEQDQFSTATTEVAPGATQKNLPPDGRPVQPAVTSKGESWPEVYQVESAYLGPVFLVPRKSENVKRTARAAHARLVSAIGVASPSVMRQKAAADQPFKGIEHGSVTQITAHVPARS